MTYAMPGAQSAYLAAATGAAHIRRVALIVIALALAVTLVAVEAPVAAQASASGRTEAQRIVATAESHIGARFRMGAEGPHIFDCSGLIYRVFQQAGMLDRVGGQRRLAHGYYHWFQQRGLASRSNPKDGDLVIWTHNGRISHAGIYVGNHRVISALINPWGVRKTHLDGVRSKFLAFLRVTLTR